LYLINNLKGLGKIGQHITAFKGHCLIRTVFVLLVFTLCAGNGHAMVIRNPLPDSTLVLKDTFSWARKMDVIDLARLILYPKKANQKRREIRKTGFLYTIFAFPGYTIATGLAGVAAINLSWRPKNRPDANLSFFNNNFQYTQYNQILLLSLSNIYTNNQKWQFPGDIRYYHFPTATYGLGTGTLPSDIDGIDYSHFRFYRTALREIVPNTFLGAGYNLDYRWNIIDDQARNGIVTDFVKYGYHSKSTSSGLTFNFLYDSRDNANRPITGTYVDFHVASYLKPLGSNSNWNSMVLDIRKYFPLSRKWYAELAVWSYTWITLSGKPPFLDLPSVGWDSYNNTGRGYAAGRYRGKDMLYLEAEVRFDIMRNGLLGLVFFGNVETFTDFTGAYFGPIQPGGGVGIRIKFNKNTNANSCLDYGFGSHGSKGLATNVNEVF
jgi:hypothetical protein